MYSAKLKCITQQNIRKEKSQSVSKLAYSINRFPRGVTQIISCKGINSKYYLISLQFYGLALYAQLPNMIMVVSKYVFVVYFF